MASVLELFKLFIKTARENHEKASERNSPIDVLDVDLDINSRSFIHT